MALSIKEKSRFKFWFDLIETEDNFKSVVYELYVNYEYLYANIKSIVRHNYRDVNAVDIIDILKEFNVKRCSRGEDCKCPDGCVQSLDNFSGCKSSNDGKCNQCVYCQRFNNNFKNADQTKQNHILEFQKIKESDKQDKFLVDLYKNGYDDYRDLSIISLRHIDEIISLLKNMILKNVVVEKIVNLLMVVYRVEIIFRVIKIQLMGKIIIVFIVKDLMIILKMQVKLNKITY